jgi:ADP-ribose pyrophosphatase YjhB (NUDIX family)
MVARVCFTLYRAFPVFGSLRASIGIIHCDQKILIIRRNDGRGLSLPGGIAGWREPAETALRREVREETGLEVTRCDLKINYSSRADVACDISVFEVEVGGELKDSWEGSPQWMTVAELEPLLLESQRPTLELMRSICATARRITE